MNDIKSIRFPPTVADDMVRALLNNRKTVTRRVVKPQLLGNVIKICDVDPLGYMAFQTSDQLLAGWQNRKCQYEPNSVLYVRETWGDYSECQPGGAGYYLYRADYIDGVKTDTSWDGVMYDLPRWRPSIHMPREAARIFLRVTGVRVERLQEITEDQARAEGVSPVMITTDIEKPDSEKKWHEWGPALPRFIGLWDNTIKKADRVLYGWDANPWVWVIGFERVSREEAMT